MAEPIRVVVTGAAGQIAYSLLYSIAKGDVFGKDQPIILMLLDIPPMLPVLEGVVMELQDCALPLLRDVIPTDKVDVGFKDVDAAILVGSMPRKEGMERKDLLKANVAIFKTQGAALDQHAKKTVRGIGRAAVQSLLQSSAKVAVVDLNATCGEQCKAQLDAEFGEGNCTFIPCDVSNGDALRDAFQATVDKFGRLDIVINNAGINNEKNWEKTIQVNLTSVIKGTYLGLEHMSKEYGKEGGTIINVSSMAAFLHSPHQPVYTATKHGVIGFTRAMADASSHGEYGVRINVLCPAFVDTPLLHSVEDEDNMGKFVKFKDDFKRSMTKFGVLQPSLIAEGMMRLIMDSSLNGAVMKITCSKGIHFHTYEPMSA
uniref:15-hydroxyprostaglandin dehydrogenase [NAD(+)] n=1 Tax=Labrus bergylta TaxID=56723 RepID=A0A3Q3EBN3_9LABR